MNKKKNNDCIIEQIKELICECSSFGSTERSSNVDFSEDQIPTVIENNQSYEFFFIEKITKDENGNEYIRYEFNDLNYFLGLKKFEGINIYSDNFVSDIKAKFQEILKDFYQIDEKTFELKRPQTEQTFDKFKKFLEEGTVASLETELSKDAMSNLQTLREMVSITKATANTFTFLAILPASTLLEKNTKALKYTVTAPISWTIFESIANQSATIEAFRSHLSIADIYDVNTIIENTNDNQGNQDAFDLKKYKFVDNVELKKYEILSDLDEKTFTQYILDNNNESLKNFTENYFKTAGKGIFSEISTISENEKFQTLKLIDFLQADIKALKDSNVLYKREAEIFDVAIQGYDYTKITALLCSTDFETKNLNLFEYLKIQNIIFYKITTGLKETFYVRKFYNYQSNKILQNAKLDKYFIFTSMNDAQYKEIFRKFNVSTASDFNKSVLIKIENVKFSEKLLKIAGNDTKFIFEDSFQISDTDNSYPTIQEAFDHFLNRNEFVQSGYQFVITDKDKLGNNEFNIYNIYPLEINVGQTNIINIIKNSQDLTKFEENLSTGNFLFSKRTIYKRDIIEVYESKYYLLEKDSEQEIVLNEFVYMSTTEYHNSFNKPLCMRKFITSMSENEFLDFLINKCNKDGNWNKRLSQFNGIIDNMLSLAKEHYGIFESEFMTVKDTLKFDYLYHGHEKKKTADVFKVQKGQLSDKDNGFIFKADNDGFYHLPQDSIYIAPTRFPSNYFSADQDVFSGKSFSSIDGIINQSENFYGFSYNTNKIIEKPPFTNIRANKEVQDLTAISNFFICKDQQRLASSNIMRYLLLYIPKTKFIFSGADNTFYEIHLIALEQEFIDVTKNVKDIKALFAKLKEKSFVYVDNLVKLTNKQVYENYAGVYFDSEGKQKIELRDVLVETYTYRPHPIHNNTWSRFKVLTTASESELYDLWMSGEINSNNCANNTEYFFNVVTDITPMAREIVDKYNKIYIDSKKISITSSFVIGDKYYFDENSKDLYLIKKMYQFTSFSGKKNALMNAKSIKDVKNWRNNSHGWTTAESDENLAIEFIDNIEKLTASKYQEIINSGNTLVYSYNQETELKTLVEKYTPLFTYSLKDGKTVVFNLSDIVEIESKTKSQDNFENISKTNFELANDFLNKLNDIMDKKSHFKSSDDVQLPENELKFINSVNYYSTEEFAKLKIENPSCKFIDLDQAS